MLNPNSCIINKIAITTTITLIILTTISYVSDTKVASSSQRYFLKRFRINIKFKPLWIDHEINMTIKINIDDDKWKS